MKKANLELAPAVLALLVLAASGCASVDATRSTRAAYTLAGERVPAIERATPPAVGVAADATTAAQADDFTAPITREHAIALAFRHSPKLDAALARLGLAQADWFDRTRLQNPHFGYARLRGDGERSVTRSLSIDVAQWLLQPARGQLADVELARVEARVAHELVTLSHEVERAWLRAVGARQIAAMRDAVTSAAAAREALAERMLEAGTLDALALATHAAAASEARIANARAASDVTEARLALANAIGLPFDADWQIPDRLPAPLASDPALDALLASAAERRLDVLAAKQGTEAMQRGARLARRWRWLGSVELGYEEEEESGDARLHGPTIDLELPIFNQQQGAVARADAELGAATAESNALAIEARGEVYAAHGRVVAQRAIAERYRTALMPQRVAVVERTQERVNFMLSGVFELLRAKEEEYDAYQAYLEAVRDYWLARVDLAAATGGSLPDDDAIPEPTVGVDAVLAPPVGTPGHDDHSQHEGHTP